MMFFGKGSFEDEGEDDIEVVFGVGEVLEGLVCMCFFGGGMLV